MHASLLVRVLRVLPSLVALWMLDVGTFCAHAIEAGSGKAPAWLESSLTLRESFDDNVFLSGVDSPFLPLSIKVPVGSAVALKNKSSFVSFVSPRISANLAHLLPRSGALQSASAAYVPEIAVYHQQHSESYQIHRFTAAFQAKVNAWTFGGEENFALVNGEKFAPTFPGNLLNAYAAAATRERRDQIQNRASLTVRYDRPAWFVRASACGAFFDLMTKQISASGYQNFVDRYDVNGGPDIGFKVAPKTAVTLGYRLGRQYQQQLGFSPFSASSDYQRVLLGVEGRPFDWLELKIQGGPDFRRYEKNTATHTTPLNDLNPVFRYIDAAATATLSPTDSIVLKVKQWQWVSSTGKIPYFDTAAELVYRRKCSGKIELEIGGRSVSSDYSRGNLPACQRDDRQLTLYAGVKYAVNANTSVNLGYAHDVGRNGVDGLIDEQTREFTRTIFSLSATRKL